ncbi:MAG: L,D-transpeptidase family protein [Gammaproteobacteria bacterium]|nr:L,D-transpeptidase family protein [Gammaproteobacteria bacterium]HJP34811.1 L,D-transpeptidase family protein [Gammaproteobacteria bacterium]
MKLRLVDNLPLRLLIGLVLAGATGAEVAARTFNLDGDLVGELVLASSLKADTLSDLARAYDQGYLEMRWANPKIDPWLPGEETEIIVPSRYILPDAPQHGVVVNVPEMRLYYFPKVKGKERRNVRTHPISIGRQEWTTPHGVTKIVAKVKDPNWYPPESIREEHAAEGAPLPKIVPAGPDNPLGAFAIRLALPGYLIHGTNRPYGIGMRVTHGCIRMYPKDVEEIFGAVAIGTPVRIVNQPFKVGVAHNKIYLEVHPHLAEDGDIFRDQFSHVVELVVAKTAGYDVQLNWRELQDTILKKSGIPKAVGAITVRDPEPAGLTQTQFGRVAKESLH